MLSQKQQIELDKLNEKIIKAISANPEADNSLIARMLIANGVKRSESHLRKAVKDLRVNVPVIEKEPEPEDIISYDLQQKKAKAKQKAEDGKYNALLRLYEEQGLQLDAALQLSAPVHPIKIKPLYGVKTNEATAIILASDCHFEERVDASTINGMNEYNLEIAKHRWTKFMQNGLKLIEKERLYSKIDNLVLWLGGDFITGYIHEELEENNYLSPSEATLFATERIIEMIDFYLEHGKFKQIHVPCNFGNHGRTQKKPRVSTGYKNSWEWMMYHMIQKHYSKDTRVTFQIAEGIYNYFEVYQWTCRTFHGDHVSFGGGIGGLTIPLTKVLMRADQQRKAHYNFMGHYHQFWEAVKNCIVNGSLIGYAPYAQRIGAANEEPIQGLIIIDKQYGLIQRMPIFCK